VIDDTGRVRVLVIDADGIEISAVADGAVARQTAQAPSSASSARRSSCAARGRSGFKPK
jgi:hypothetical protein